ncbi:MAG TPA: glycosyltransferase family 4 protein [Armatimonadota bacterium]|nr:glycosyltransferase family 4 protein [Armatimonadota bacterium]
MRILLIHQNFATPAEGGGTRHFELGRHCSQRGHEFVVVTSPLSYLSGRQTATEDPPGSTEQVVEGVRIRYAYAHPSLHRSFVWRLFSFISFTLSAIRTALGVGSVDLVVGTSPPLPQALSAWYVSRRRRCPFLLEIRDLWPEFAIAMGVLTNPVLVGLARCFERFLYRRAHLILVNSPAYRDYLTERGVPAAKIRLIPNGVDPAMFDPDADGAEARARWGLEGRFVVVYAGALGMANDIATLLRAVAQLEDIPHLHLLLVGTGRSAPTWSPWLES